MLRAGLTIFFSRLPVAGTRTGGFVPSGAVPVGKQGARNPALGLSPAAPECSSHDPCGPQEQPGTHPTGTPTRPVGAGGRHSSSVLSCLTHQVSTCCHAVPAAQAGTCALVLGQSPFGNWRHPTPRLLLISHRRTRTESPPALPCSQLSQSPTVPKPQGGHTKPNKASPCPRPPQEPDVHLSPPQGNASSGERIDGGARSSHQLPREEPWLPSPPASCSNHLFCFYFRKRWGSALRRSQPPSQPPHRRARRQISAKR